VFGIEPFRELLTSAGQRALAAAAALQPDEAAFLKTFDALRRNFPADLAKAAVETAILRRRAAAKFTLAGELYFTREALEQSTAEPVARWRARQFQSFPTVLDIGCGIGGDAMVLAQQSHCIALDRDELRLAMAAENVRVTGGRAEFLNRDALLDELPAADAAFADPARRTGGERFLGLADYAPPPADLLRRLPDIPLAFKLAPGVPWRDLEALPGTAEFISLDGELKECCLWVRGWPGPRRRATRLPAGVSFEADRVLDAPTDGCRGFIGDPDAWPRTSPSRSAAPCSSPAESCSRPPHRSAPRSPTATAPWPCCRSNRNRC
jgi:SAM-dependent methyltransferase